MGGNNSHVLTIFDVARLREWLLITLEGRFRLEIARKSTQSEASSIHSFLLQTFQRYDAASSGCVEREAALVIAHDLTFDNKWTRDQIERFCELFAPFEDDNGEIFNYRLFVSFLFFPVERQSSKLKLKQSIARMGPFDVYPGELVSEALSLGEQGNNGGFPVIAKKLSLQAAASNNRENSLASEIEQLRDQVNSLRLYSHPNTTRYVTTIQVKDALFLVEESHESCTLRTILESFGAMKEPTIRRYLLQLLQGIQFLHARDTLHGDLSTHSVNIDSYGLLKLSEFGIGHHLMKLLPQAMDNPGESQDWTAKFPPPEASRVDPEPRSGKKSDIWRVGILILQMANGFSRENETTASSAQSPLLAPSRRSYAQQKSPQKRSTSLPLGSLHKKPSPDQESSSPSKPAPLPTLPQTASKQLRNLVRACLQRDPRKRASVDQLIQMDFFQVDAAQATNEMLRTVCTDLDASMKRLISSSSTSTSSPNTKLRSASTGGSPVRTSGRSTSVQNKYQSFVPATGRY